MSRHQLGTVKFDLLDRLQQQQFRNMFCRLSRDPNAASPTVDIKTISIHRHSLLTLIGSLGIIIPKDSAFYVGAAAALLLLQKQQHQQPRKTYPSSTANSASDQITFDDAVKCYDEAVTYSGKSMAEAMEFFALLDDDGDGVVDVGVLRQALCVAPSTTASSSSSSSVNKNAGGITEAEFYYALDAAKLLTGPAEIGMANFDEASSSRLGMLKVDDDLRDESAGALPPTAPDAPITGTIVPGGITVYQFLNLILRFSL